MNIQHQKNLPWRLVPMSEDHARQICKWRYEGPYAIYTWSSWEELCRKQEEFADPEIRSRQYLSAIDVMEPAGNTIDQMGTTRTSIDVPAASGISNAVHDDNGIHGTGPDPCAVYTAPAEELCGYAQLFPLVGVTRLGLGLRPDLCGRGLGSAFVKLIAQEACNRQPANEIDLEVLIWNTRAIKAYERAGFHITDTYERNTPTGPDIFHCMVFRP
jgi:ribosomal protein S18 acetylase RimI-like enzyme